MAQKDEEVVPGLVLEPDLAAKLDNLDDNLQPINEKIVEKKDEVEDEKSEETEEDIPEERSGDVDDREEIDKEPEEDSDDGYAIDDGEEEAEEQPSNSIQEEVGSNLTPEQKYIIDNLTPITVRGTIGADGDVKEYQVYSPEYLPQGFKYTDDRELSAANKAFSMLESRATQLQSDYRGQQTQKAASEFKQREDTADRQDIATLQRDGKIPLFKAAPNSSNFEKDPGVQLVQEVIDFKEAQNAKYMDEYNSGRPYKHIGFDEAFRMFQRDNPTKSNPAQTKEDKERLGQAKRTSKTSGTTTNTETPRARVHSGMTGMDLESLIESKTADW